jgi:hypothetical protein
VNERAVPGVDSPDVAQAYPDQDVTALLGGGLLSERIRQGHEDAPYEPTRATAVPTGTDKEVSLGAASQIEIEGGEVRFLVPFAGRWPGEHWLRAFREAQRAWPDGLVEPLLDEGRGLQLGPLSTAQIDDHVQAVKDRVAAANRIYVEEIEPELRRQREEALRREEEQHRLQVEVEAKLRYLLG